MIEAIKDFKRSEPEAFWLLIAITVIFGGVGIGVYFEEKGDNARQARFMTECQEERKRYECEAMWRAGNTRTHVQPMPIIIPIGR